VTIRTLRFYDRAGLLEPSVRTHAGHRLYTDDDLFRLEQILALKYLGFSLAEIKEYLREGPRDLKTALAVQKRMLLEKKRHLESVIRAIEHAEHLASGTEPDWESIIQLIQAMKMTQSDQNAWKKFYTEEQVKILEERAKNYTPEMAARDQQRWNEVISSFKRLHAEGKDPASPEAQEAAHKYWELINEFTMGDPGILKSLKNMYQSEDSPFPNPFTDEESAYIQKALEASGKSL
jgi:DNA-binding transcriptional MerR regulator